MRFGVRGEFQSDGISEVKLWLSVWDVFQEEMSQVRRRSREAAQVRVEGEDDRISGRSS
jgi:hypothetical protein